MENAAGTGSWFVQTLLGQHHPEENKILIIVPVAVTSVVLVVSGVWHMYVAHNIISTWV